MTSDSQDPTAPAIPNLDYVKSIIAGTSPFSNISRPTQVPYQVLLCENKLRRLKWQIPGSPIDIMVLDLEGGDSSHLTWRPLSRQSTSSPEDIEADHEIAHELVT